MANSPKAKQEAAKPPRASGRRNVLIFWGAFAVAALCGIGVLQYLGPPPAAKPPHTSTPPAKTAAAKPAAPATPAAPPPMRQEGTGSTLAIGQAVPAPLPALLAPSATNSSWLVPHVAPNGMTPMRAYSGSVPPGSGARVAVLVAGIGDDDSQSQEAVTTLPSAISLAFTPYGQHIGDIATLARAAGHEILLAIPMQEADPATQNAGNEALVMAGPITQNQPMLDWNFSRLQGYAGVTDAIGVTQGAGFMTNPSAKSWLLQEIADKGLFFIDARQTGAAPYAWNRTADVVIDPVGAPDQEGAQLSQLAVDAKLQGDAMGILLNPAPGALRSLANWAQTLANQGVTLVPVSALVLPPNANPTTTTVTP